MQKVQLGLITTLLLGVFIVIGALIAFLVKKKQKVVDFSIGLAFGVIVFLIIMDLLPEIIENLSIRYLHIFIICTVLGYFILKLLDNFIPDHEEDNMTKKELKNNLAHIGIVTSLAIVLHNIIEGMAIYSSILSNTSLGMAVTLGVGCHNIPLGIVIAGSFYQSNQNMSKTILSILLVSLSTFVGGIIMFFLNINTINSLVLGILLSITLGMLLFLVISELFPRIRQTKDKKTSFIGVVIGVILILLASLF